MWRAFKKADPALKVFVNSEVFVFYNFSTKNMSKKTRLQKKRGLQKNTPSPAAPSPRSPRNEWNKRNITILLFAITIFTIGGFIYLLSQIGVVKNIIGTAVGLIAAFDLGLITLLITNDIKLNLRRRLHLSEDAYIRGVIFCLGSINFLTLFITLIIALIIPSIQSNVVRPVCHLT